MSTITLSNDATYVFAAINHETLNLGGAIGGDDSDIHPTVDVYVATRDSTIRFLAEHGGFGAVGNASVLVIEAPTAFRATIEATVGYLGEIDIPSIHTAVRGNFHDGVLQLFNAQGQTLDRLHITGTNDLLIHEVGPTAFLPHGGLTIASVNTPPSPGPYHGPGFMTYDTPY